MARTLRSDFRGFAARASDAVPGWVGGAMAGLQSALLSAAAVVAVALAVAAASPPADGTAGVNWGAAAGAGVRVWLLAHGVAAGTAVASVSLVPLGLTAVFGSLAAGLARRFAVPTTGSWLAFTVTYAACAGGIASASHAETTAPHAVLRAAIVGILVAGGGAGAGLHRAGWLQGFGARRVPARVSSGLRLGAATALGLGAAGAMAFCLWSIAGWSEITRVAGTLDADPVGTLALALGEAAYAPTLAIWGVAWLAGPGFTVGTATVYAPGHLTTGPLPSIPLLGSLPHATGGLLVLAPLVVLGVAAAARLLADRFGARPSAGTQAVAVATVTLLAAAGAGASRGSLGGGALASVGPSPVATALWVALLVTLGFGAASLGARFGGRPEGPSSTITATATTTTTASASARQKGRSKFPGPSREHSLHSGSRSRSEPSPPP